MECITQNHESQNKSLTDSLIFLAQRDLNSIKQHSCQFLTLLWFSLHDGWKLFHAFYELKMGKSTHTACAAILVGHVHCKLSERAIPRGAVGLCACSANQKARLGSHDHSMGSHHQWKLRSPQWQTMK